MHEVSQLKNSYSVVRQQRRSPSELHATVGELLYGNEIWKDIKGYEGLYQVSNYGRVKRLEKTITQFHGGIVLYPEKIMKTQNVGEYLYVGLRKKGKKMKAIHRLVGIEFIKNRKNKKCINHIDNNPKNNNVTNLEWCTYKENMQHASKQKRMACNRTHAILTIEQVKKIKKLKGKVSPYIIGSQYNVNRRTIQDIFNNRTWINI